ncbi:MAG: hypothetical protein RXR52_33665 [Paraburkholderia sp.]|uniref:hypothetical protein n=1 Tax=Burkholderiaceae TaxID=119060 RepID=UPI00397E25C2
MSDSDASWGMCEAYGCKLLGTIGHGGKWFCFCHAGSEGRRDAITAALAKHEFLVNATLDIRRYYGTPDWQTVYRGVHKLLTDNGRPDLLFTQADNGVRRWLARLESALVTLTREAGKQQPLTPTGTVTGPTSAPVHFAETDA